MRKYWSLTREQQGSVSLSGMMSVLLSASTIILVIFLSAFVILKANVETDVYAQVDSRNGQFEALSTHNQIISSNKTYSNMTEHLENPGPVGKINLEEHLESTASILNQQSVTIVERQYSLILEQPNSDIVNASTEHTNKTYYSVKSFIASPKKNPAVLEISVSR